MGEGLCLLLHCHAGGGQNGLDVLRVRPLLNDALGLEESGGDDGGEEAAGDADQEGIPFGKAGLDRRHAQENGASHEVKAHGKHDAQYGGDG